MLEKESKLFLPNTLASKDAPAPAQPPAPALIRPPAHEAALSTVPDGSPTRANLDTRQAMIERCLELRFKAYTYKEIADMLGIHFTTAGKYIQEGLEELARVRVHNADALRQEMTNQIHFAMSHLRPKVEEGIPFAVEKWLSCIDRLAKLWGVDAPIETKQLTLIAQLPASERVQRIAELLMDNLPASKQVIDLDREPYTTDLEPLQIPDNVGKTGQE